MTTRSTLCFLLFGASALRPCGASGADRLVKPVPANGTTLFAKRFDVPANTSVTGVEFECSTAGVTFPAVSLVQGSPGTIAEGTVLRSSTAVPAASTHVTVEWSAISSIAPSTCLVVVRLPAGSGVGSEVALAADDVESPTGSFVSGSDVDALLPVKADLAIELVTTGSANKAGSIDEPGGPVRPALEVRTSGGGDVAKLSFATAIQSDVKLEIFDVAGRLVRVVHAGPLEAGTHHRSWDGRDEHGHRVSGGVYVIRLRAGDVDRIRKLVVAH